MKIAPALALADRAWRRGHGAEASWAGRTRGCGPRSVGLGGRDELSGASASRDGRRRCPLLVHLLAGPGTSCTDLNLVGAGPTLGELPGHAACRMSARNLFDAEDVVAQLERFGAARPGLITSIFIGASSPAAGFSRHDARRADGAGLGALAGAAILMASRILTVGSLPCRAPRPYQDQAALDVDLGTP